MKNMISVLLGLLLITGCKKTVEELPAATQTGAQTFGLKLDGKNWVPQRFAGINTPILEVQLVGTNDIRINAMDLSAEPIESEFVLYIKNATGPGVYPLNQTTDIYPAAAGSYGYYVKRRIRPLNEWITSPQHTGSVTLTRLDLTNGIVSGTFEFSAGSIGSTDPPINVTEGRFDLKLQ